MSNSNPKVPKALISPNDTFKMSAQYVSGDIKAVASERIGIKSGVINSSGNLIRICKIMVFPGVLAGGAEIIRLKLENTKAAMIIAVITRK